MSKDNKRSLIITSIIVLSFQIAGFSQTDFKEDKKYKIWISLNKDPFKLKGFLYKLNDSSIILSKTFISKEDSAKGSDLFEININHIEKIKIRRKGSIGRGATIGGISGLVFGSIIMLTQTGHDDSFDPIRKFSFFALPLATLGSGIGVLFGSFKAKIQINGNINTFNSHRENLQKITIE